MEQIVVIGDALVLPGKKSATSAHGSQSANGEISATVCGVFKAEGSFTTVTSFSRYKPDKGDVVIGRVVEVGQGSWRVDIDCDRYAKLDISSIDLPNSIQRRRTAADELNMRHYLVETDLISAEVTKAVQGWPAELYAGRSRYGTFQILGYGKLKKGQVVKVKPYLLKMKKHVHLFAAEGCQARIIFGCNGCVWMGDAKQEDDDHEVSLATRELICRLANAVRVLNSLGLLIEFKRVVNIYEMSVNSATEIKDMLHIKFERQVAEFYAG